MVRLLSATNKSKKKAIQTTSLMKEMRAEVLLTILKILRIKMWLMITKTIKYQNLEG